MKYTILAMFSAVLFWTACQSDGVERVKETPSTGGPNSDMVRNPVTANLPTDTNQLARISYVEKEFDYGTVPEGTVVVHEFQFTNSGNVPLLISNCRSSCGCTIPDWPREPIPPGGTGKISAKFNTQGKHDVQRKMVYVTANTYPNETNVLLKGTVQSKE